jgi:hypothetical protein
LAVFFTENICLLPQKNIWLQPFVISHGIQTNNNDSLQDAFDELGSSHDIHQYRESRLNVAHAIGKAVAHSLVLILMACHQLNYFAKNAILINFQLIAG